VSTVQTRARRTFAACVTIIAGAGAPDVYGETIAVTSTVTSTGAEDAEIAQALAADQETKPEERAPWSLQSLLPDIALIGDFALAWFSEDENLQGGAHDPVENGFNLQQLELSLAGKVDAYFRFDANIVFSLYGVEVEEAYATTLDLPGGLQLRAGQFLTRFGRLNATHPHSWNFADSPFANTRVFGGEGNRGLGVELSWLTPLPWYVELVGSTNTIEGGPKVQDPFDLQWLAALKQFFPLSEDLSLSVGVSAATSPNTTGRANRTDLYGADLYLKYRPITEESTLIISLQSEVFYRRRQIPEDLLSDVNAYAELFVRFAQRFGVAGRFELGTTDPEYVENRYRGAASLTFWPTEFSRLRAQGSIDVPRWLDEPIYAAFLAAEFSIGAHGAHTF
jgi:hypothetical protein